MMTFNKMEQLLYFSIYFLSKFLIINYLSNIYLPKYLKTIKTCQNDRSTPVILVLKVTEKLIYIKIINFNKSIYFY